MNYLYRILLSGMTCLVLSSSGCDKTPDDPKPASCPTPLTFTATMDGQGSIMISGVSGGTPPYSYAVANQNYQSSEVFAGPYADGSYVISVRSNGGCETSNVVSLSRAMSTLTCFLNAQQTQLLTNGSTKVWHLIRTVSPSMTGPTYTCTVSAYTPSYTFSADGSYQHTNGGAIASAPGSTTLYYRPLPSWISGYTEMWCGGRSNTIRATGGNSLWDVVALTATRLVVRAEINAGTLSEMEFVAP